MSIKYVLCIGLYVAATFSCTQQTSKKYTASFVNSANINVDGLLDKSEWRSAKEESDFTFPWLTQKAPATHFYALVDTQYLNFVFQVDDSDIVLKNFTKESDVAEGDRVEMFFSTDADLKEYYCLEMAPNSKVLDYRASYYRKFDDSWNCEGLQVVGKISKGGYVVEGKIPIATLKILGILDSIKSGSCFLIGLYRAEYSTTKSGKPKDDWISWVRPETVKADFHVPSSFGLFCIAN